MKQPTKQPKQQSFASYEFASKKRVTRREKFLAEMEQVVPWARLQALIEPKYPTSGRVGRQPVGVERMLRMYFLQQWFGLAYRALKAESKAEYNGRRPKACKLALNDSLRSVVATKLEEDWSPQQISGWLRKNHHGDLQMQLSHEAIYRTFFIQTRGLLKRELVSYLRSRRMMRRSKDFTTKVGHEAKLLMQCRYIKGLRA